MFKPDHYIGRSSTMCAIETQIANAARLDLPVLIVGETGVGKERIAHELHRRSARSSKPFVAINVGAMPPDLIASELFGHVRGAFTGATQARRGLFMEAGEGTLFLDEIGTMDFRSQMSLLRVLENNTIRAVGASKDVQTSARIIAATNQDLEELVADGGFRKDLMYRLDVMRIDMPPLRAMRAEIPGLAAHFVREFSQKCALEATTISAETLELLQNYPWPGNIRELRNVIIQACVSSGAGEIRPAHLPARFGESPKDAHSNGTRHEGIVYPPEFWPNEPTPPEPGRSGCVCVRVGLTLQEVEHVFIRHTLLHCRNNKTHTARMLGMSRKTLHDRLNRSACPQGSLPKPM